MLNTNLSYLMAVVFISITGFSNIVHSTSDNGDKLNLGSTNLQINRDSLPVKDFPRCHL